MTTFIVVIFLLGYLMITLESSLKVNKTAVALLLSVLCWVLYMSGCDTYVQALHGPDFSEWQKTLGEGGAATAVSYVLSKLFIGHIGDASEIIFFLMHGSCRRNPRRR